MTVAKQAGYLIGEGLRSELRLMVDDHRGRIAATSAPSRKVSNHAGPRGGLAIRRGTFQGPWAKGDSATVTDATLSAVTYTATNYFAEITASDEKTCAIAYANGEWILIAAEC